MKAQMLMLTALVFGGVAMAQSASIITLKNQPAAAPAFDLWSGSASKARPLSGTEHRLEATDKTGRVQASEQEQRRFRLFLKEFGDRQSNMNNFAPPANSVPRPVEGRASWYLRTNGTAGFLYVDTTGGEAANDVVFSLGLYNCEDPVVVPSSPVMIPGSTRCIWPVNIPLTEKVTLGYATAMPLCVLDDNGVRTVFLAETKGVPSEIGISADRGIRVSSTRAKSSGVKGGNEIFEKLSPSRDAVLEIKAPDSMTVRIVLLSEADSLNLFRVRWLDQERVVLWSGVVKQAGDQIDLYDEVGRKTKGSLLVFPNPPKLVVASQRLLGTQEGVFTSYDIGGRKQTVAVSP